MNTGIGHFESPGTWVKSSYSNGAGGECVECAHTDDSALIRDSKREPGTVVRVGIETWRVFVRALARAAIS
ncbi:DUF397 domain-containing protein [Streptomyces sp. MK7]|uniref:DUF397 domain-containing protein n=1 Tax=Streptomyces sp. MK7 TaxID=3067635 RepID=UPI00292E0FAF|nr:DUF397 domain-containing protein [Streptomyces sp. MK7]